MHYLQLVKGLNFAKMTNNFFLKIQPATFSVKIIGYFNFMANTYRCKNFLLTLFRFFQLSCPFLLLEQYSLPDRTLFLIFVKT